MKTLTTPILFLTLVLASLGFLMEIRAMMGYLDTAIFWKQVLVVALPVGTLLAGTTVYIQRAALADEVDGMRQFLLVLFIAVLGIPPMASVFNRWSVHEEPQEVRVTIESEQARYGSRFGQPTKEKAVPNQYLLFFYWNNQLYKAASPTPHFPSAQPGDVVMLRIQRGRLGWHWVVGGEK